MHKALEALAQRGNARPIEQEMKLTDLFLRATRRAPSPDPIEVPAHFVEDRTDRSSMADLARLLQKFDDNTMNAVHGKSRFSEMKSDARG